MTKKRYLYHGTSKESAESIIKEGFKAGNKVWGVSEYENIYFWDTEKDENECKTFEELEHSLCSDAAIMARHAAAKSNSMAHTAYILKFEVLDEDYVDDDVSSPNMYTVASCMYYEHANTYLKLVDLYELSYSPALRLFYFIHKESNFAWHESLTDIEREMLKNLQQQKFVPYLHELCDYVENSDDFDIEIFNQRNYETAR